MKTHTTVCISPEAKIIAKELNLNVSLLVENLLLSYNKKDGDTQEVRNQKLINLTLKNQIEELKERLQKKESKEKPKISREIPEGHRRFERHAN